MNIEKYIQSGILEQYCLGLTSEAENKELEALCIKHSKLNKELEEVQKTLGNYANSYQTSPRLQLKHTILYAIDELDLVEPLNKNFLQEIDLKNPPLLYKDSNFQAWTKATASLEPVTEIQGYPACPIRVDDNVMIFLIWINKNVVEETHENESESFFVLEGTCVCNVSNIMHPLKPGDFLGIPTYKPHTLEVTSPSGVVKLLVQRAKLKV